MHSPCTEICFIRHGETLWNREHRMQGWQDIALNDTGRLQANLLAARLADEATPFTALYSSPLARAMQTAQPIAERLGLTIEAEPGLRERCFGVLEGIPLADVKRLAPAATAVWQRRDPLEPLEGGESLGEFQARILAATQAIARRHAGARVIAVTHGGALDILWRAANHTDLTAPRAAPLLNASINRIRISADGQWQMLAWADVAHLPATTLGDVTP